MLNFLKPLSFLPAILMMYLIFTFSAQDGVTSAQLSYKVSYKIIETGGELLGADFEPWEIDNLATRFHGAVRKLAHMTEYFALAVAVAFPLYVYGLRGFLLMLVAGLFCVAFACGDEYHQAYIDGRGPSKRDVLIDSFGVFWGIVLVRIVGWTGRKTIFRPFGKKKKGEEALYDRPPMPPVPPYPQEHVSFYPPRGPQEGAYRGGGTDPYSQQPYHQPYPGGANPHPQQPYPGGEGVNPYRQPYPGSGANPYPQQPYPGRGANPYPQQPYRQPHPDEGANSRRRESGTSDRLSEDLSLKKLMHDLKDQKKK